MNPDKKNSDGILFEIRDGAARATLNRPECANALHGPALSALARAAQQAAADANARALLLDGVGKHFCAGADARWMLDSSDDSRNIAATRELAALLLSLRRLPKPVIAFAHGACAGGGAGLCAAADIVAADESAVFSFGETRLGIIPAVVAPYVVERIGAARARRLFISGEKISALEAVNIGLADCLVDSNSYPNPRDKMEEILREVRARGPNAVAAAKRLPGLVAGRAMNESLADETAAMLADIRKTAEAREGLSAFLEKREPNWIQPDSDSGGKDGR